MKQIFDWLRGQVPEKILPKIPVTSIEQCVRASCYNKMLAVIAEAEAKWESECCEWKPVKWLDFPLNECVTSCGYAHRYNSVTDRYCRHCGKPIKISEVE